MPAKAAASTAAGCPAMVTTVRLWSLSELTLRMRTASPPAASMAATMASITSGRRASEKLGTHSTSERGVDMATSGGGRDQATMEPRHKNAVAPLDGAEDYTKGA